MNRNLLCLILLLFTGFASAFAESNTEEATKLLQAALPADVTIAKATPKQLAAAVYAALQQKGLAKELAKEIVRVGLRAPAVSHDKVIDPEAAVLIVRASLESMPALKTDLNSPLMKTLIAAAENPDLPPIAEGTIEALCIGRHEALAERALRLRQGCRAQER